MGVHDKHRERVRERFHKSGLEAFADHEVLELLLFYAVPRRDTNEMAHNLIKRFGSLDAVFTAPVEDLVKEPYISETAATLIRLILPLYRRLRIVEANRDKVITSTVQAGEYFIERFVGERQEVMYLACIDLKGRVLACHKLAEGDVSSVNVNIRKIVQYAILSNASAVVLAHNHPSGIALPSNDDTVTTLEVIDALKLIGVEVLDHIIVADDDYVSMRESGIIL
ncbi:MAG: DNA repair protein RadC [Oscillospiraceae bacterium]|nr:DNA repair protein RadC [Oscillospiraceae bacterium]